MNLRELEVIKIIVECGSFSMASEQLFIAQPALSKTIQRLEKKIGATLFERSNRIVRITNEGQLVYEKAVTMLQQMKELKIELKDMNEHVKGHLKVGLPQIIGTFFFPQVAKAFSLSLRKLLLKSSKKVVCVSKNSLKRVKSM
ncbi:LysR family transcriptional regulator [Solibacillus sp. FSL H8-0538]|uniref:LysR family transcriptional regulator n=1 Tax=Solibacillus sp. FSL H8-0538 TaxID=2921400 RepID=UPI0030F79EA7